jgi:hypothetical protein
VLGVFDGFARSMSSVEQLVCMNLFIYVCMQVHVRVDVCIHIYLNHSRRHSRASRSVECKVESSLRSFEAWQSAVIGLLKRAASPQAH